MGNLNLIQSVRISLRCTGSTRLDIIKSLPVCIHKRTNLVIEKNANITVNGRLTIGNVWPQCPHRESFFKVADNATVRVHGDFKINTGCYIRIERGGTFELGSGFINNNVNISCVERIVIGHDVAISNDVMIRDSDGHKLISPDYVRSKPVEISDHVWIGMRAIILKGVTVGEGSVIAAGAIVTKDVPPKSLVGGNPARVLRSNIEWKL